VQVRPLRQPSCVETGGGKGEDVSDREMISRRCDGSTQVRGQRGRWDGERMTTGAVTNVHSWMNGCCRLPSPM